MLMLKTSLLILTGLNLMTSECPFLQTIQQFYNLSVPQARLLIHNQHKAFPEAAVIIDGGTL